MNALMNDTEATLLSHAYANPATRISFIWGTGVNAAIQLPVSAISSQKLGKRSREWMDEAKAVLVNTEISMFGEGIFPLTAADVELDSNSTLPGFQPLEQLTSGRYLGEIFRLTLVDGAKTGIFFNGVIPEAIKEPFSLDTAVMSQIERNVILSLLCLTLTNFG